MANSSPWKHMNEKQQDEEVNRIVTHYRNMKLVAMNMYNQVMRQYKDMANGGDGGPLGYQPMTSAKDAVDRLMPVKNDYTCREYNDPGYPDYFFARVLAKLGEEWKHYGV